MPPSGPFPEPPDAADTVLYPTTAVVHGSDAMEMSDLQYDHGDSANSGYRYSDQNESHGYHAGNGGPREFDMAYGNQQRVASF